MSSFFGSKKFEKIDTNFYMNELNISDARIKYIDKMIKENSKIPPKKII